MKVHAVSHIPTLHGKIFEGIFPMWKCAKLLPSEQTKSNLISKIYCPNFGGNYKENARLKRMYANLAMELDVAKYIIEKKL